ncbi:unnamed protein product, partial [Polarella glacialis]
ASAPNTGHNNNNNNNNHNNNNSNHNNINDNKNHSNNNSLAAAGSGRQATPLRQQAVRATGFSAASSSSSSSGEQAPVPRKELLQKGRADRARERQQRAPDSEGSDPRKTGSTTPRDIARRCWQEFEDALRETP